MKKIFIIFTLFFTSPLLLKAQLSETIRTARPGQSFGPFTVGKRIIQIQGGVNFFNRETASIKSDGLRENLVLRYGIAERVELSAVFSHSSEELGDDMKISGVSQMDAGFRIHLFQRPSGFAASWQNRIKLNSLSRDYQKDQNGFVSAFSLGYPALAGQFTFNGGALWNGNDQGAIFTYSLRYGRFLTDHLLVFVEPYGNFNDEWSIYANGGLGWLINKDFMVDASVGADMDDDSDLFFIDFGFSYRILGLR